MGQPDYQPADRRPIATRDLPASRRLASWLAARSISPNGISIAGMLCALAAGGCFAATATGEGWGRLAWIGGALLAQGRLLANMLDGMVAIERGVASPVGELYNEVPDRVSDAAVFIGLGYATGGLPWLGYAAALAAVFTACVRAMAVVAGAPQDYAGPMAKPHRMFLVTLLGLYCGIAPGGWQPQLAAGLGPSGAVLAVVAAGSLLTASRRLLRAARYLSQERP